MPGQFSSTLGLEEAVVSATFSTFRWMGSHLGGLQLLVLKRGWQALGGMLPFCCRAPPPTVLVKLGFLIYRRAWAQRETVRVPERMPAKALPGLTLPAPGLWVELGGLGEEVMRGTSSGSLSLPLSLEVAVGLLCMFSLL